MAVPSEQTFFTRWGFNPCKTYSAFLVFADHSHAKVTLAPVVMRLDIHSTRNDKIRLKPAANAAHPGFSMRPALQYLQARSGASEGVG